MPDPHNLLACGFVHKEIADQLGIGTETVKTYVKNICKKLHMRNRLEAVARFGPKYLSVSFPSQGLAIAGISPL